MANKRLILELNRLLVSVIIPTANAKVYLEGCLASIVASNSSSYEVIVVDNKSVDGTVQFIRQKFPRVIIVQLDKNYGPAKARNEGAKIARGKYLGFLDSDTQVQKNWLIEALRMFKKDRRIAAVQCKLLIQNDKKCIDYVGEHLGNLGFLVPVADRGEADHGQYDSISDILAAKSAGMFVRKDVFDKIGGFDEDYFMFVEETDLGWRCWLAGYRVVLCPKSVVYHYFSASKNIFNKGFNNYLVRFHGSKNYILTLYKNLSMTYALKILPIHVLLWLGLSLYLLARGNFRSGVNILRGISWNVLNVRGSFQKRQLVQHNRIFSDDELFEKYKLMIPTTLAFHASRYLLAQKEIVTTENQ